MRRAACEGARLTRVVVTGASGFIGQHLVRRLLAEGFGGAPATVVAIVRHSSRYPADLAASTEVHELDLATAATERIAAACGRGAVVFHLAADASVRGGAAAVTNNVRATSQLVAALQAQAPRRLVLVSSIGAVDRLPSDRCDRPLTEDSPPNPLTSYGRSKLDGERVVAAGGLPFTIVRPTWVYGPGMREDSHLRVLLAMVRRGALSTRVHFPGRVSVIHVNDLCSALLLVAASEEAAGRTYFASDGTPVAIGELFALMGEFTARRAGGVRVPAPVAWLARRTRALLPFAAQNLHSDVLLASNDRLEALGFRAQVPLRSGIAELAGVADTSAGARRTWLVTGAANGIGRSLAEQLRRRGARVIAVDRDAAGLAAFMPGDTGVERLTADLASTEGRAGVVSRIESTGGTLDGVINCAGVGARGRVGDNPGAAGRAVVEVNVSAVAELSAAAVARLRAQPGGGTLVNVASSAALQPLPMMAVYAASKAFVLSYSEAIAAEQAGGPVRVITVCPPGTDTGFQAAAGVRRVEGERLMSASEVAAQILAAVDRGRSATLFIGSRTVAMSLLARLLPRRVLVALWGRMMAALR